MEPLPDAPVMMVRMSANRIILEVNPETIQRMGYSQGELEGAHARKILTRKTDNYISAEVLPRILNQEDVRRIPYELKTSAGENMYAEGYVTLSEGLSDEYIVVLNEVTSKVKARRDLQCTIRDLSNSHLDLNEFALMASRDLKRPLWEIGALLETVEKALDEPRSSSIESFFTHAQETVMRMHNLISSLLLLSKVDPRAHTLVDVDLVKVISAVFDNYSYLIESRGVTIQLPEKLPKLRLYSDNLGEAISQLVDNALKYVNPETPTIISLEFAVSEHKLEVKIKDNGLGFTDYHKQRIFDPLSRFHTHNGIPGSGIGLSICERIMRQLKGSITAEGEPGKGACFTLDIPIAAKMDVIP